MLKEMVEYFKKIKFKKAACSSALEEVQLERETHLQVEEVREVCKPPHFKALKFLGLHKSIRNFVTTGELGDLGGYQQAFAALGETNIGRRFEIYGTKSQLFVSTEFMRIVDKEGNSDDDFFRPVEWVLWSTATDIALIVIPEEAEELMRILRSIQDPKVYLIAHAAPFTRNMSHFHDISYYAIPGLPTNFTLPELLSIELGIFSGRLYLDFWEDESLKKYLYEEPDKLGTWWYKQRTAMEWKNAPCFSSRPVDFLLEWLPLRRNGQDISNTPMGYILEGRPLKVDHAFFRNRADQLDSTVEAVNTQIASDIGSERSLGELGDLDNSAVESENDVNGFEGGVGI